MSRVHPLIKAVRCKTSLLEAAIEQQQWESVMSLIDVRNTLLDELVSLAGSDPEARDAGKTLAEELLPGERAMMLRLSNEKTTLGELLGQVSRSHKAAQAYTKIIKE